MAHGGARSGGGRHKRDCECEKCKSKYGSRPTNAGVAGRVLAQAKSEKLWHSMITLERRRLGIGEHGELLKATKDAIDGPDYKGNFSIIPLTNLLRYLEDRAYGRCTENVNHMHDKPIEMNVNVSIAEVVRKVRERKESYERSRK